MADSYGDVWRKVRLYCPLAPPLLVIDWVKNATRQFSDERNWSFLRSEGEFLIDVSRTGNAVLVQNSDTVTSTGGADGIVFAAADVGRQLRLFPGPPLTITAVSLAGFTSCTLERQWKGVSAAVAAVTVCDVYATCPADFGHFIAVVDPQNQRRVRIFMTDQELHAADPGRINTGTPWALVNYRLSQLPATLGRVQYEWWPEWIGTATMRYPYYYIRRPSDPAEDDTFLGPLRDRGDVVLYGALAQAARWPGLAGQPNPFFNLQLAAGYKTQFETEMARLEVRDEETFMTWLDDSWWARVDSYGYGVGPVDAQYMQSHE